MRGWFHGFVFFCAEAGEEAVEARELQAASGVGVFGRGDVDVDHVELRR